MASISEQSVAKILTVYHHGIEKKFHYDGFEINSESDIKRVLQIDKVYYRLIGRYCTFVPPLGLGLGLR